MIDLKYLNQDDVASVHAMECPDCKTTMLEGPSGGLSICCYCPGCGQGFVDAVMTVHRIPEEFNSFLHGESRVRGILFNRSTNPTPGGGPDG